MKISALFLAAITTMSLTNAFAAENEASCRGFIKKRGVLEKQESVKNFTYSTDAKMPPYGEYAGQAIRFLEDQKYLAYLGISNWGKSFTLFIVEKTKDPKEMTSLGLGISKQLAVTGDSREDFSKRTNLQYFNDEVFIDVDCTDLNNQ